MSSKLAKAVTEQLVKNGFVRRPFIGVTVVDVDDAVAAQYRLKPGEGVLVTDVFKPSPASKANLGIGDLITKVNGLAVNTARDMQKAILGLPIGQAVDLLVLRKGQLYLTRVTAEEQPDVATGPAVAPIPTINFDAVGLTVTDLTADYATKLGLPKGAQGVVVSNVAANSLAAQSGVTRGQIVIQVDKTPVPTADVFRHAVEQASREKGAVLHVLRPNGDIDYVILRGQ